MNRKALERQYLANLANRDRDELDRMMFGTFDHFHDDGTLSHQTYTSANTNTASEPVTFESLRALMDKLPPPPPPAGPSTCKGCAAPLRHTHPEDPVVGMRNTECPDGLPVYAGGASMGTEFMFFGPPACYVCPSCYAKLKEMTK